MRLLLSCSCLWPIHWSQVLSRDWGCSWSGANKRCYNYIWMIYNVIVYYGASYIMGLMLGLVATVAWWRVGWRVFLVGIIGFKAKCLGIGVMTNSHRGILHWHWNSSKVTKCSVVIPGWISYNILTIDIHSSSRWWGREDPVWVNGLTEVPF